MANVLTVLQLIPNDSEMNFDDFIENSIQTLCKEHEIEYLKYEKTPVAYGLYAMLLYIKNSDSDEGADQLNAFQEAIEGLNEVQTIELQNQTLIDY